IAAAAADVAAHRAVDLVLRGVLVCREERGGLHDLTGLAIAALRDVENAPGLLNRVIALRIERLDRRHRATRDIAHRGDAGTPGLAVDVTRASPAQRDATAVFRSGEPQLVPQIPEQRHRLIAVERLCLAIDL